MNKLLNILFIEDHPLIVSTYENAIKHISNKINNLQFHVDIASDCDLAYEKVKKAAKNSLIDIVFLDIKLPPSKDGKITSGEDLGIQIRALTPNTKIIVATTYNDNYRINTIFKSLNPDGFLIKNDLNPEELILAIESVIDGKPYYSESVIKFMRNYTANNVVIDSFDRKILFELSNGAKMSELANIIPLSLGAIEQRKRKLKNLFNANTDRDLLVVAKQKGFI